MTLSVFQWFLIIINIISFVVFSLDFFIYSRGGEGVKPAALCELVTVFGGALGTWIAFILWDRKVNKLNIMWRIFAGVMLVIQIILVLVLYGPHREAFQESSLSFWNENKILLLYLAAINIVTFIVFGIDKLKAIFDKWRIPVVTLIGLAVIGGSVGGILGMILFRHKIRKPYFLYGLPMILFAHLIILVYLKWSGIL